MAKHFLLSHSWPLDLISHPKVNHFQFPLHSLYPSFTHSHKLTELPSLLVFKSLRTKNHLLQGQTGWQFLSLCRHAYSFLSECFYPLKFIILKLKQNIWDPLLRKPWIEIVLQLCAVESSYVPFPSIITSDLEFSARSHPHTRSPVQP